MKQTAALSDALAKRILILDGAMGTMLQSFHFTESDFRGTVFADHPCNLTGDNDVLNLTQPGAVLSVHTKYLEAGAEQAEWYSLLLQCLEKKGLISLDYDKPLRQFNERKAF